MSFFFCFFVGIFYVIKFVLYICYLLVARSVACMEYGLY